MKCLIIYATVKDRKGAEKISLVLIKEKLAACVNYFPMYSVFKWQGKIEKSEEWAMLVKTKESLADHLIERIKQLHSYDCPCILAWDIEKGSPPFLEWIEKVTKK